MRHHLLSFVGSGNLHPVRYALSGESAGRTAFMEIALSQLLALDPAHDAITVFVTSAPDVQANWNNLLSALEQDGWTFGHNLIAHDFVAPKTEAAFRQALSAIAARAFEGDPTRVSLDITHGFRAFAALGIKALELELADRERAGRDPVPTHIYYGALEEVGDHTTDMVPIWDLSEVALAAEWSAALSDFERHGRADRLRDLSRRRARPTPGEPAHVDYLHRIGGALQRLADDLCFLRRDVYRESATHVVTLLSDHSKRDALHAQYPTISASLNRVREMAAALAHEELLESSGLIAIGALLDFYARIERFAEAYVVMNETVGLLFDPTRGRALRGDARTEAEVLRALREDVTRAAAGTYRVR